jgi:hypothetical protein
MFMSTATLPTPASRCLSGPCPCRRCAHQQEEAFGVNGVTRWTLGCAENLLMRVSLICFQVLAYFVEKVPFYLLPELLFYSRAFCPARRQRRPGHPWSLPSGDSPYASICSGLSTPHENDYHYSRNLGHNSVQSNTPWGRRHNRLGFNLAKLLKYCLIRSLQTHHQSRSAT